MTAARRLASMAILALSQLACGDVERRVEARPTPSVREVELEEKTRQLQKELEEEREKNRAQTEYISDATKTVNEIQDELNRIGAETVKLEARKYTIESQTRVDRTQRDDLMARVANLTDSLRDAEKKLSDYKEQIKEQGAQLGELAKTIENLQTSITLRDATIKQLRHTIESMKTEADMLKGTVINQGIQLDETAAKVTAQQEKIDELNEGFYVVDSFQNLERNGIIRYEGGVLKIRRVPRVDGGVDKAPNGKVVDIREAFALTVPHPCKKVRVVSEHDSTSWKKKDGDTPGSCKFFVTDPRLFWRTRHLVIGVAR